VRGNSNFFDFAKTMPGHSDVSGHFFSGAEVGAIAEAVDEVSRFSAYLEQ